MIYRGFGAAKAERTAGKLRRLANRRGLVLLIGSGDPRVRGVGAHLPERLAAQARRFRRRGALITAAAHNEAAIRRARRLAGRSCDDPDPTKPGSMEPRRPAGLAEDNRGGRRRLGVRRPGTAQGIAAGP